MSDPHALPGAAYWGCLLGAIALLGFLACALRTGRLSGAAFWAALLAAGSAATSGFVLSGYWTLSGVLWQGKARTAPVLQEARLLLTDPVLLEANAIEARWAPYLRKGLFLEVNSSRAALRFAYSGLGSEPARTAVQAFLRSARAVVAEVLCVARLSQARSAEEIAEVLGAQLPVFSGPVRKLLRTVASELADRFPARKALVEELLRRAGSRPGIRLPRGAGR